MLIYIIIIAREDLREDSPRYVFTYFGWPAVAGLEAFIFYSSPKRIYTCKFPGLITLGKFTEVSLPVVKT